MGLVPSVNETIWVELYGGPYDGQIDSAPSLTATRTVSSQQHPALRGTQCTYRLRVAGRIPIRNQAGRFCYDLIPTKQRAAGA